MQFSSRGLNIRPPFFAIMLPLFYVPSIPFQHRLPSSSRFLLFGEVACLALTLRSYDLLLLGLCGPSLAGLALELGVWRAPGGRELMGRNAARRYFRRFPQTPSTCMSDFE